MAFLDITAMTVRRLDEEAKTDAVAAQQIDEETVQFQRGDNDRGPFEITINVEDLWHNGADKLQITVDFNDSTAWDPDLQEKVSEIRIGQMGRSGNLVDLGEPRNG